MTAQIGLESQLPRCIHSLYISRKIKLHTRDAEYVEPSIMVHENHGCHRKEVVYHLQKHEHEDTTLGPKDRQQTVQLTSTICVGQVSEGSGDICTL